MLMVEKFAVQLVPPSQQKLATDIYLEEEVIGFSWQLSIGIHLAITFDFE